ncbi:hypothetical protein BDV38DRAFT_211407 [Aspergillus pseudotamarii]|uniref:Uncharacterized protein n=1 Tax=Aspergillus pseudotamarii TaxID=132259 RepID=A0A5N6SG74_ASPPS|nr:uncharacterized protein BDV38DRAFT_211407 [Aspergillus pseudotamarii]KAE8132383.1 hypothetical protein BDV38DRAFT_211407 [Aspergillus pseudotamarii]
MEYNQATEHRSLRGDRRCLETIYLLLPLRLFLALPIGNMIWLPEFSSPSQPFCGTPYSFLFFRAPLLILPSLLIPSGYLLLFLVAVSSGLFLSHILAALLTSTLEGKCMSETTLRGEVPASTKIESMRVWLCCLSFLLISNQNPFLISF